MSVYLSYGKNVKGLYEHVTTQSSGKGSLYCPFCDCSLIAVRGKKKAAHFRHDGETCNESLNEIPQIEGWHHFHLNFPLEAIEALRKGYDSTSKSPNTFQSWKSSEFNFSNINRRKLLKQDEWSGKFLFTDTARVVLGSFPLTRFSDWMRSGLQSRVESLLTQVNSGLMHRAFFEIEAHRQQSILSSTLYFFEYQLEDGSFIYKVGRTNRDTKQRLEETVRDLGQAISQKITLAKVIRAVANSGHVEKYVFHRFCAYKADIGNFTEYLMLDDKALRKLKSEFTKLSNNVVPFAKEERFIATGRWKYEDKRLAAAKRGIELTKLNNGVFGRPKGTTLSTDDFLKKHSVVVELLQNGLSVNTVVKNTGKSRSTVKRVKSALKV